MRRHRHSRSRSRRLVRPGHWHVHARVERYVEPSLLLLLRERPLHGYELLERIPELGVEGRVDIGNLYRLLRSLEDEGLVSSEWSADLPGPAKRTYELTDDGPPAARPLGRGPRPGAANHRDVLEGTRCCLR